MGDSPRRVWAEYNAIDNVIDVNLAGVEPSAPLVDEVVDEIIAVSRALPERVYVLVCWQGVVLDERVARRYSERLVDLAAHVRAMVRYATTDTSTRATIRAETMKNRVQNSLALIFDSRAAAIEEIRSGAIDRVLRSTKPSPRPAAQTRLAQGRLR